MTWIYGWKEIAVPGDYGNVNTYMWIPIVAPLVGAAIAAPFYDLFIGNVLKARGVVPDTEVEEEGITEIEVDDRGPREAGYAGDDDPRRSRRTDPPGRTP